MQGKKVLVIDDDFHTSHLVEAAFVEEGAEVVTAVDGPDGLRQFNTHKPDLVIIDLMTPEMDGWETTERITSLRDDADAIRGLEWGDIDFVTKPFSPKVLVARARAALRYGAHDNS